MEQETLAKILELRNLARKIEDIQTDMVLSPYWKELTGDPGYSSGVDPFSAHGRLKQAVSAIAKLVAADLKAAVEEGVTV